MVDAAATRPSRPKSYRWVGIAAIVVVIGAMALDTTIVEIGSVHDVQEKKFSPQTYGAEQFPLIKQSVETRAVNAVELATAIAADKKAAGEKYGVKTTTGPVIPVTLTGVFGERKSNYNVMKSRVAARDVTVRVQTGPAINGTDLRDATGTDRIRPVHQPDRVSGRRFGHQQRDEEGRFWRARSDALDRQDRRRWSASSSWSTRRTGSSRP
jgi:hypothetical protein